MPHNFDKEREFLRGCATGAKQAQPAECYDTPPARPGVRGRIYTAFHNAELSADAANAAARANELLDKYPGLDELLDLVFSGRF